MWRPFLPTFPLCIRKPKITIRGQLLANLIDEEAGSPNHPELWLQFAEALGLTREEVLEAERGRKRRI